MRNTLLLTGLAFALALFSGCTAAQMESIDKAINDANGTTQRRADAIAAHQEWSAEVKEAINTGHVLIGMTREQCTAAWGEPQHKNLSGGSWGSSEQWVYADGQAYLYFGTAGTLENIQSRQ